MLLTTLGGCAQFHAQPLQPAATQSRFQRHTLTARGLLAYIHQQHLRLPRAFPKVWNLESLTAAAWYYSPALKVAIAQVAVAEAGEITAGQRPNPSVALSPTYAAKAGPGISPWILGFNFDIPIETAGRRHDRMMQAAALTTAQRFDLGQTAWDVRQRIRRALINYFFAQRQVRLWRQHVRNTALAQRLLRSRLAAGDISRPVYAATEIQAHQAVFALVSAQGLLRQRRARLAGAMVVPVRALAAAQLSYGRLLEVPPVRDLAIGRLRRAALLNRMDIQSLLAQYRAAEAALRLQVARQYPDIHLGPGYSFNQGANEFTLGLTVALPVLNQNQGPIATANAQRRVIAAEVRAKQIMVITQIRQAVSEYRAARRQWHTASAIEAQARAELRMARRAFHAGAQSRLALTEAQLTLDTFTQATLASRRTAVLALGNLEDIVEIPMGHTPTMPKGTRP